MTTDQPLATDNPTTTAADIARATELLDVLRGGTSTLLNYRHGYWWAGDLDARSAHAEAWERALDILLDADAVEQSTGDLAPLFAATAAAHAWAAEHRPSIDWDLYCTLHYDRPEVG